ncbi:MAG: hypothetical protein WBZ33_16580 [Thermoactinomyces sp.]|jgi:hypothetical protein
MIISPKALARAKAEKLKKGYAAFVETQTVAHFLKKEIAKQNLRVIVEQTPHGCWFTPLEPEE